MLPAEYEPEVVPPSLIYGAQHLLRLFVKEQVLQIFEIFEKLIFNLAKAARNTRPHAYWRATTQYANEVHNRNG